MRRILPEIIGVGLAVMLLLAIRVPLTLSGPSIDSPHGIIISAPLSKQPLLTREAAGKLETHPLPNLGAVVSRGAAAAELMRLPGVEAHPNLEYKAMAIPNDSFYASQWSLSKINAAAAWNLTTGSAPVTIAVIDTGYALAHEELASQWATNPGEQGLTTQQGPSPNCTSRSLILDKSCNNIDDDANGYTDDWRGWDFSNEDNDPQAGNTDPSSSYVSHGTLIAGLAGAKTDNAKGIASLNWSVKLLPLQALGDDGAGYTDQVAAAIRYAVDSGAKVISLSLGASQPDSFMRPQIQYAISRGVTVVAAAGNDGCDCMSYPANYDEVIAVGSSDSGDNRAGFSSYGANLDVLAPGVGITGPSWINGNGTTAYSSASGTSTSTPLVSSLISLMLSRDPDSSPYDLARFLDTSADILPGMNGARRTNVHGYGRPNSLAGLLAASLGGPQGQLLNKRSISLSSTNPTTDPNMDTACSAKPGKQCSVSLFKDATIKTLGTRTTDAQGNAEFSWNAASLGLTPGTWLVQSSAIGDGQTADGFFEYLVVNP